MKSNDESIEKLLNRMRLLAEDHAPDGWPAVQMRDITALLEEIDRRMGIQACLKDARRERDEMIELLVEIGNRAHHASTGRKA